MRYYLTNFTKKEFNVTNTVYSDAALTTKFGSCKLYLTDEQYKFDTSAVIKDQVFIDGYYNTFTNPTKKLVIYLRPGVFVADTDTGRNDIQTYFKCEQTDIDQALYIENATELFDIIDWPAVTEENTVLGLKPMHQVRDIASLNNDINLYDSLFGYGNSRIPINMLYFQTSNMIYNIGINDLSLDTIQQNPGRPFKKSMIILEGNAVTKGAGALSFAPERGNNVVSQARWPIFCYMSIENV